MPLRESVFELASGAVRSPRWQGCSTAGPAPFLRATLNQPAASRESP